MSINTIIGDNYLKFNSSGTSYVQFTKNAANGIIDLSSYGNSTVLFKNARDPVDPQDLATRAYVLSQSGSTPGGITGSIQFNNTTFSGTTEFLYDGIRTITIGSQANTAIIQAPSATTTTSAGGSLNIVSGEGGSTSGNGGNIVITAGTATSGTDGIIILRTNGADNFIIDDTSVTYILPIYAPSGTIGIPSYTFSGDTNTGIYSSGPDSLGITIGGSKKIGISSSGLEINGSTSGTLTLNVPTTFTDYSLTFPVDDGTNGQFLTSNGSGILSWTTASGTVTSVSGTTDRITSTGGTAPVIDIASTYIGQSSITTLGTIGSGVWNGTVIDPTYGGTGVNNGANTITLAGNLTTVGAFPITLTSTAPTSVTLPTSGTLLNNALTNQQIYVGVGGVATAAGTNFLYDNSATAPVLTIGGAATGTTTLGLGTETRASVIQAKTATSTDTVGSALTINSGSSIGTAAGTDITIAAGGSSGVGSGGNVILSSGISTSGTHGSIVLQTNNTTRISINTTSMTSTLPIYAVFANTPAAPAYSFSSGSASGMYSSAANTLDFSTASTNRISIGTTATLTSLPIRSSISNVSSPSYSFTSSTNTGMFSSGSNTIDFVTGGVTKFAFSSGGQIQSIFDGVGIPSLPAYSFNNSTTGNTTGMYSSAANTINFSTASTNRLSIGTTNITSTLPLNFSNQLSIQENGVEKLTTFLTNGTVLSAVQQIYLQTTSGGVNNGLIVSPTNIIGNRPFIAENGSSSAPSYSFTNSSNAGMYLSATNIINFSTESTNRLSISSTNITSTLPLNFSNQLSIQENGVGKLTTFLTNTTVLTGTNDVVLQTTSGGTNNGLSVSSTNIIGNRPFIAENGSSSAPSYSFTNSANAGMYSSATNIINFSTASTNRLSLSTTTLSSTLPLNFSSQLNIQENGVGKLSTFLTNTTVLTGVNDIVLQTTSGGTNNGLTVSSTNITTTIPIRAPNGSTSAPSFAFTSANNTGIYSESTNELSYTCGGARKVKMSQTYPVEVFAGGSYFCMFRRLSDSFAIGSIQTDNVTTYYYTTSDRALKKNIIKIDKQLSKLRNLKPSNYKWVHNDKNADGFIADEVKQVYPEICSETGTFEADGTPIPEMVDYSKLTVNIIAGIQELMDKNDEQDAIINKLKLQLKNASSKISTNVGSGDYNITPRNILDGIIYGTPSGNKTWILPSSSSIMNLINIDDPDDLYVGRVIQCIFNNYSATKSIRIDIGVGMAYSGPILKCTETLALNFRFDNISEGDEIITIYKG